MSAKPLQIPRGVNHIGVPVQRTAMSVPVRNGPTVHNQVLSPEK
jgi:hypothetical protein